MIVEAILFDIAAKRNVLRAVCILEFMGARLNDNDSGGKVDLNNSNK